MVPLDTPFLFNTLPSWGSVSSWFCPKVVMTLSVNLE